MVIQHNLSAMNSNRQLYITTGIQAKSSEKLSSGYRINRAADDAAGLAISEKMRRQVRGLTQASANCQDGVSLVQVADGALAEVHDMLHRGSELSIKAANDTLTREDREYIQSELDEILTEIDSIKEKATFNEIKVLCGGENPPANYKMIAEEGVFLMGQELPAFVTSGAISAGYMNEVYEKDGKKYPAGSVDFSSVTEDNAKDLIGTGFNIDCSTCTNKYTFKFVEGTGSSEEISGENYIYKIGVDGITSGSELIDRIIAQARTTPANHFTTLEKQDGKLIFHENRDWPGEKDMAYYQRQSRVLSGEAYSTDELDSRGAYDLLIQAGSETDPANQIPIRLANIDRDLLGLDYIDVTRKGVEKRNTGSYNEASGTSTITGEADFEIDGPADAIERFKNALGYVSKERSRMGAYQNRLEHTIKNLDNVVENTQSAESRIRDTDMAAEMVKYSNNNILAQAGQSMLAQANQTNQGVLTLLQ